MKILHFSSMAGIGEILSNEANLLGHQSVVIQKRDLDPFGFGEYYRTNLYVDALDQFVEHLNEDSKDADVVIVHDWIEFLDEIECDHIFAYFHGSKLRGMSPEEIQLVREKTDGIFVSTPDLKALVRDAFVLPQPVDLRLFKDKKQSRSWKQMTINRKYQQDYIEPFFKERFPECVYYARNTTRPYPYAQMPDILNKWQEYVDIKFDYSKPEPKVINAYSTTALQALACGCKVFDVNGDELPKSLLLKHDSKSVIQEFINNIASTN